MAWYNGTFSCGHEGRVNIIGPTKNREWKKEREFSKMCPECYKKWLEEDRKRKNQEALKEAKEMELPELKGTTKQVEWANTLRNDLIKLFQELDEKEFIREREWNDEIQNLKFEDINIILDYVMRSKVEARYYIDNRGKSIYEIMVKEIDEALKPEEEKEMEHEIFTESTVFPENKVTDSIAKISYDKDKINVKFEKNEDFRQIVKSLKYKWEGIWERKINNLTGTAEDRAAELGNKLLNAGFPIMILDENVRNNAVKGIYEQECDRWIFRRKEGNYAGWLAVKWYDHSDLYSIARKLPGSRYDNGYVMVNISHYKEAQDFANLYGFKFTEKAIKAIEEYKEQLEKVSTVKPVKTEKELPKDGLQEILNSGSDVLDDLRD